MRCLLTATPFALLPMTLTALAHDHSHEEHGSLDAHVHGVAELNVALDGSTLELQLKTPAMNFVGFEHEAESEADKAKVASAKNELSKPVALFGISQGQCTLASQELESPLFEEAHAHEHEHEHEHSDHEGHSHAHNDIQAHYQLNCQQPDNLKQLDLTELFKRFPATEKINVQLIGPNGQKGQEVTASNPTLSF
ncbi:DUF2796 domain-containing protein [Ectopseudomonas mendocina]|uniref:DUF2796 domain-containing protein n=1 Tax=Ectopseudomonas mendocina TaxID=300 RepID=A0ABZ2RHP9_ECTME